MGNEVKVVDGGEGGAEHFFGAEKVGEVGAGIIFATVATAVFFDRFKEVYKFSI